MTFRSGNYRVGVVSFSDFPSLHLSLDEGANKKAAKSAVAKLRYIFLISIQLCIFCSQLLFHDFYCCPDC